MERAFPLTLRLMAVVGPLVWYVPLMLTGARPIVTVPFEICPVIACMF